MNKNAIYFWLSEESKLNRRFIEIGCFQKERRLNFEVTIIFGNSDRK